MKGQGRNNGDGQAGPAGNGKPAERSMQREKHEQGGCGTTGENEDSRGQHQGEAQGGVEAHGREELGNDEPILEGWVREGAAEAAKREFKLNPEESLVVAGTAGSDSESSWTTSELSSEGGKRCAAYEDAGVNQPGGGNVDLAEVGSAQGGKPESGSSMGPPGPKRPAGSEDVSKTKPPRACEDPSPLPKSRKREQKGAEARSWRSRRREVRQPAAHAKLNGDQADEAAERRGLGGSATRSRRSLHGEDPVEQEQQARGILGLLGGLALLRPNCGEQVVKDQDENRGYLLAGKDQSVFDAPEFPQAAREPRRRGENSGRRAAREERSLHWDWEASPLCTHPEGVQEPMDLWGRLGIHIPGNSTYACGPGKRTIGEDKCDQDGLCNNLLCVPGTHSGRRSRCRTSPPCLRLACGGLDERPEDNEQEDARCNRKKCTNPDWTTRRLDDPLAERCSDQGE